MEVLVNFLLPFLLYDSTNDSLGNVQALMISSTPPILWSIVGFARERRVDAISIVVLAGIALSLIAFTGGGGAKFLQLRENLVSGLVGLVFLGSAAIGRPLFYQLTRAGLRRRSPDKIESFEALREDTGFRRAMLLTTLAWGAGLVGACAVNCLLVFSVSVKAYLLISPVLSYSILALMIVWTFWYVTRAYRNAEVRQRDQPKPIDGKDR